MKKIILIFWFISIWFLSYSQLPNGVPIIKTSGYYELGYIKTDSGAIVAVRDTNWLPRFPGTAVLWQHAGSDSNYWYHNGTKWNKLLKSGDITATTWGSITGTLSAQTDLQNALNLKLNKTDTTGKWVPLGTRLVDSVYGVNDSTVGVIINGSAYTFQIKGGAGGGGGSGITSLNGLTGASQTFGTGTTGTDFGIVSSGTTHTFNLPIVSGSNTGKVTPTLFNLWNAKQPAGNYITALTGRGTASGPGSAVFTLSNSGVTAGSYTNANITINADGTISAAGNGSGGTGGTNSNVGAGNRWAVPNTNNIKTAFPGFATLIDSTSNSQGLTYKFDSTGGSGFHTQGYNDLRYAAIGVTSGINQLTGDVTAGPGTGSQAATIANNAVTIGKMATNTANKLSGWDGSGNFGVTGIGSGLSLSGSTLSATGVPESIVGQLYAKGTWTSIGQFTNQGGTAPTISSGHILFPGGNSDFVRSLNIDSLIGRNGFTDLKNFTFYAEIVTGTKTATSKFGIGLRSQVSALLADALIQFDATNTGSSGKISFVGLTGANDGIVTTSTSAVSFTAADKIGITIQLIDNTVILSAKNITTSASPIFLSTPYTFSFDMSSLPFPNSGKFAIFNLGGSGDAFTVDSLNIFSGTTKNAAVLVGGDSKTQLYPVDFNLAWPNLIRSNYGSTVTNAGSSEAATDLFSRLPELLQLNPRTVVISIGRNGGSSDTLTAYLPLVDSLQAHGITVIHFIEGYDALWTAAPQFIIFLRNHFPANTIVDGYTPILNCPACLAFDNVHLSILGHQTEANVLSQANLLARGTYVDGIAGSGISNQIALWDGIKSINGDNSFLYNKTTALMDVNKSLNSGTGINITNSNSGSSASPGFTVINDAGNSATFGMKSTTGATYGGIVANAAFWYLTNNHAAIQVDQPSSDFGIFLGTAETVPAFKAFSTGVINMAKKYAGTGIKVAGFNAAGDLVRTTVDTGSAGGSGISTLNTLTAGTQTFAVGTGGSDFNISSATSTHTFNIPDAGASARGLVTTGTQTFAGTKTFTGSGTNISNAGGFANGFTINSTLATSYSSLNLQGPVYLGEAFMTNGSYSSLPFIGANAFGFYTNGPGGMKFVLDDNTAIFSIATTNSITPQFTIQNNGVITMGHLPDSAATATGGYLFRDAATGNIKIGSGGSGGGVTPDTLHVIGKRGTGLSAGNTNGSDSLFLNSLLANNGLTGSKDADSTNHVVLGGDLAQNTTLTLGSNNLIFTGTSTGLFKINGSKIGNSSLGYTVLVKNTDSSVAQVPVATLFSDGLSSSGTYTPTLTNGTNVAASVAQNCHWWRVGNEISVTGIMTATATLTATTTVIDISLPVASGMAATTDLSGLMTSSAIAGLSGGIEGNLTSDIARLTYTAVGTGSDKLFFHFTYTFQAP